MDFLQALTSMTWPTFGWTVVKLGLQFGLLLLFGYWTYNRLVRQSPAADRLVRGVFLLFLSFFILWFTARQTGLSLLELVFGASLQLLAFGLIVIFQPELRRVLGTLGQSDWFFFSSPSNESHDTGPKLSAVQVIEELDEAIRLMAKAKTGALLVLEPPGQPVEGAYLETGTPIHAAVTAELLLTIFHPNTPLHDGAVVINNSLRLASAGALLPLTEEPNLSWRYGTRHRAAIGLSEQTDCACLVVSEETGNVSFVKKGELTKLTSLDELSKFLERFYHVDAQAYSKKPKSKGAQRLIMLNPTLQKLLPKAPIHEHLQQLFTKKKEDDTEYSDSIDAEETNA